MTTTAAGLSAIPVAIMIRISFACCCHCSGHGLYIDWNQHPRGCRSYWGCAEGARAVVRVVL